MHRVDEQENQHLADSASSSSSPLPHSIPSPLLVNEVRLNENVASPQPPSLSLSSLSSSLSSSSPSSSSSSSTSSSTSSSPSSDRPSNPRAGPFPPLVTSGAYAAVMLTPAFTPKQQSYPRLRSFSDSTPSCILDGKLWVGNYRHASDYKKLKQLGIDVIINVAEEVQPPDPEEEEEEEETKEKNEETTKNKGKKENEEEKVNENEHGQRSRRNSFSSSFPPHYYPSLDPPSSSSSISSSSPPSVLSLLSTGRHVGGFVLFKFPFQDLDSDATRLFHSLRVLSSLLHRLLHLEHRVLLHCQLGVSRSVTVAMAYCLLHAKKELGAKDLKEVVEKIMEKRPVSQPNWGFVRALQRLECEVGRLKESTYRMPKTAFVLDYQQEREEEEEEHEQEDKKRRKSQRVEEREKQPQGNEGNQDHFRQTTKAS